MISPASLTIFLIWRLPIQRADLYPALGKRDVLETGNSAKGSKLYLHAKPLVVNRGASPGFSAVSGPKTMMNIASMPFGFLRLGSPRSINFCAKRQLLLMPAARRVISTFSETYHPG